MKNISNSKRHALVLGCSKYDEFKELTNPVNDAEAVKVKLESFGFKVECAKDANHRKIVETLGAFLANLNENTSDMVIYYAGHGCNIREYF